MLRCPPFCRRSLRFDSALAILSITSAAAGSVQAPISPVSHTETIQDLVAPPEPGTEQQFDEAMKAFNTRNYSGALAIYQNLLQQMKGDAILSKFAGEAAINTGDTSFALSVLRPLAGADPNDWQAAALLTRACAESGDTKCRDSGMAHMLDLHRQGITPQGMPQYILERVKAENTLLIRTSLEPWGFYKVYDLGQLSDRAGKVFFRITLESNDADQSLFAKQHPKEASEGLRGFSLDAYQETGLNSNGQRTQTHYTYAFFVGQPPYETVRAEFINIANGKANPMSSRSNLVVP